METRDVIDYHGRFVWYELMTTDMAASKVFYASVVGWGAQDASTPRIAYTLFTAGKAFVSGLLGLSEDARKMGAMPRWVGYVGVDDVDAAVDQVKRRGGAVHLPPTDFADLSRFSIVADPQMASLALIKWLRPNPQQAASLGKPGRVGWHELHSTDSEKAFAFYGELFDWQKADADAGPLGTYQLFSAGGQTIGGMFTKPATVPIPFWLYYFNVGDIDVAAERVRAGGGHVIEGPLELPGGSWIARCMDPQGAMFALEGKRNPNAVGYFARVASRGRPAA
jgi:predicted enzyme related to lactoylglutathione lyase